MKKLKKSLIIVATLSCMLLALALSAMAANLDTTEGNGPDSSTANENSFLFTPVTKENVTVHIGGNGNSARLIAVIDGRGTFTTNDRPVNNAVNTIHAAGFEIDVFVRGNKIDGVLGVWDLNCYNTCPEVGPDGKGCTPTREKSCECACICEWECNHICNAVVCNDGETCEDPISCGNDGSDCKEKPAKGELCIKDDVWVCPWECTCVCECDFQAQGCECDKCPICDGCNGDCCGSECCKPCECATTKECAHAHWLCNACNGHRDNHGPHQNCADGAADVNGNINFFCLDCEQKHPDGWQQNDEGRPDCYASKGCTTDDCPDDECSGDDPPAAPPNNDGDAGDPPNDDEGTDDEGTDDE